MSKNIVILTSNNPLEKSGRTSVDLQRSLTLNGINSVIFSDKYFKVENNKIISLVSFFNDVNSRILNRFKKFLFFKSEVINKDYYMFSHNSHKKEYNFKKIIKKFPFTPDVIVYVFCRDFLNEEHLYKIQRETGALIIRFTADNHELTGGCHFFWNCKGYLNSCGSCPGLFSKDKNDITNINFLFKKKYIDKTNCVIVGGSEWQYEKIKKSNLYKNKKKYKILNPTDNNLFYPANKNELRFIRDKFDLPLDTKIRFVLFGAVNNSEKRKGAEELYQTFKKLTQNNTQNIHLLVIGNNLDSRIVNLGLPYTNLGYVKYEDLILSYQIADVYVSPSIEDAGPSMINQAVMCGTPVVSFNIGVSSDLVVNNKTGYVAQLGDSNDLAKGILKIINLNVDEQKKYSEACRELAIKKCSLKVVGEKFKYCIEENI